MWHGHQCKKNRKPNRDLKDGERWSISAVNVNSIPGEGALSVANGVLVEFIGISLCGKESLCVNPRSRVTIK